MPRPRKSMLAVGSAILFLTACGGSGDADAGPNGDRVLSFMHRYPEDAYAPYFEEVARAYEAENAGVSIEITAVGNDQYRDQLTLLTGQDDLPDLFWATPGNLERQFVDAGLAYDLTDEVVGDWRDRLDPMAVKSYEVDGRLYGIPIQSNYKFLAYNPAIFEAEGLTVPETLEDLYAACDDLRDAGYTPLAFGNAEGWPAIHYMTAYNGYFVPADVREEDYGSIEEPGSWEHPGYVEALEALGEIDDRCHAEGAATATFDTARASFLSGDAAMYAGSFGEFALIANEVAPEAFPADWGIANLPAPSDAGGDPRSIAGAGNGIMVKDGPNAELAIDFLEFMTTLENGEKLIEDTGFMSAVAEAATRENTTPQAAEFMFEIVPDASSVNMWLDNALPGQAASTYSSAIEGFLGGQLSADEVVNTMRTTEP